MGAAVLLVSAGHRVEFFLIDFFYIFLKNFTLTFL